MNPRRYLQELDTTIDDHECGEDCGPFAKCMDMFVTWVENNRSIVRRYREEIPLLNILTTECHRDEHLLGKKAKLLDVLISFRVKWRWNPEDAAHVNLDLLDKLFPLGYSFEISPAWTFWFDKYGTRKPYTIVETALYIFFNGNMVWLRRMCDKYGWKAIGLFDPLERPAYGTHRRLYDENIAVIRKLQNEIRMETLLRGLVVKS